MQKQPKQRLPWLPWRPLWFEMFGTAVLLFVGLSLVTAMFGAGGPLEQLIPNVRLRQVLTGFLFGSVGAAVALSVVGKESGAHLNPVVTMVFWLFRKLDLRTALQYVLAQCVGAILGCLPLLAWGTRGESVSFGVTVPGVGYSARAALLGEIVATFTMVLLLVVFLGFRRLRQFTPAMFPVLYAILVPLESHISGTSTNPARSLGPAVISGEWQGWWIYWVGPVIGALLASAACSFLAKRITVAKLYYFESDRDGLFRRMSQGASSATTPSKGPRSSQGAAGVMRE